MTGGRILREPLLHFLAGGALLFAVFSITTDVERSPEKTIRVDKETLVNFLQYRSKAFESGYFTAQLDAMSAAEREALVQQYIEEEILLREAQALGLDEGDYVIRQRLVQKMRFLMDDLVEPADAPAYALLEEYLQKNAEVYTIAPSITFTHVFLDSSIHGDHGKERAEQLKVKLNSGGAAFNDAPRFGDRFPFLQNYVERTFDYVASHLGDSFAEQLKSFEPSDTEWRGPLQSTYGYHLVLVTSRIGGRLPQLEEIRTQVEEDWLRERIERGRMLSMKSLAAQYTIDRQDVEEGPK